MPSHLTNAEAARAYADASARDDLEAMAELRHPDWTTFWPQSGELVRGNQPFRQMADAYPGGRPTVVELERIVGDEDRWVVSPGNTIMRVAGSGDFWWCEWRMRYPDDAIYHCVSLMELRDSRVWREVVYWASPFDAPSWRSEWVERS